MDATYNTYMRTQHTAYIYIYTYMYIYLADVDDANFTERTRAINHGTMLRLSACRAENTPEIGRVSFSPARKVAAPSKGEGGKEIEREREKERE